MKDAHSALRMTGIAMSAWIAPLINLKPKASVVVFYVSCDTMGMSASGRALSGQPLLLPIEDLLLCESCCKGEESCGGVSR